ncbi:hypothetical protein [Burkholderia ubonensis]|uniref:hypothetical protein n=1 Tax=Burkholderia ubonensis TaxID=101571 RepID=UPI000AF59C58|nr:hypothetical protein [Burkholderia ubonensis]
MPTIVDANVLREYFREHVLEIQSELTHSTLFIFDEARSIILDGGGQIENEWRNVVDPEWFDVWLARKLEGSEIDYVEVSNCPDLCNHVYGLGFPKGSRDIWYLRTAVACALNFKKISNVVTEDIDFYNPKKKSLNGAARVAMLKNSNAPIRKTMKKNYNVNICCVEEYSMT